MIGGLVSSVVNIYAYSALSCICLVVSIPGETVLEFKINTLLSYFDMLPR